MAYRVASATSTPDGAGQVALIRSLPSSITTYPFSMGCWVKPYSLPSNGVMQIALSVVASTGTDQVGIGITKSSGIPYYVIYTGKSTTNQKGNTPPQPTTGTWGYMIGRFISSSLRKICIYQDGAVTQFTNSGNVRQDANFDRLAIGGFGTVSYATWLGDLREAWFSSADLYDSVSDLPDSIVRQLAYQGPLSVPSLRQNIIDYKPLRKIDVATGQTGVNVQTVIGENYQSKYSGTWTANTAGGAITTSPDPILPPVKHTLTGQIKPKLDTRRLLLTRFGVPLPQTLTPSRFDNTNTFYTHLITNASYTLSAPYLTDGDAFYSPTVYLAWHAVNPGLYSDGDTFFSPIVRIDNQLRPELFTETNTFYAHTIRQDATLTPDFWTDADTFYSVTISGAGDNYLYPATPYVSWIEDDIFFNHTVTKERGGDGKRKMIVVQGNHTFFKSDIDKPDGTL